MFLCTCLKVVVTTLPKFSRQYSEKFCCISGNDEKLLSLPKNFICKNFVWTCTTIFWQACRNHACKSTKDVFRSKSDNDSNAQFSKRSIFSFISLLQKIKKNLHLGTQNAVVTTLPQNSCENSQNRLLAFRNWWKIWANKVVSPQNVRQKCTMKFWQAWRNFVPKNTKKIPELQKCWSYNFFNKFFFRQRWFFSNVECNFDKASKSFL